MGKIFSNYDGILHSRGIQILPIGYYDFGDIGDLDIDYEEGVYNLPGYSRIFYVGESRYRFLGLLDDMDGDLEERYNRWRFDIEPWTETI